MNAAAANIRDMLGLAGAGHAGLSAAYWKAGLNELYICTK